MKLMWAEVNITHLRLHLYFYECRIYMLFDRMEGEFIYRFDYKVSMLKVRGDIHVN